jgi:hypothetical protein
MKINLLILSLFFITEFYSQKNYTLLDYSQNSELNYKGIDSINSIARYHSVFLDSIFNFVKGENIGYRFISKHFTVDKFSDTIEVNELLILLVSNNKEIIDGFQYTLDYPEVPAKCDLYRLKKNQNKNQLEFGQDSIKIEFELVGDSNYCDVPRFIIFNLKLSW